MAIMFRLTGIKKIIRAMEKKARSSQKKLEIGLVRAGLFLQRESQKVVPVDTGALKNSAFTRKIKNIAGAVDVAVGYTQSYAIFVHENLNARHKPGKIAKYLETPARIHRKKLLAIVKKAMK